MKSTVNQLNNVLLEKSKKFKDDPILESYIQASDEYNLLLKEGKAQKRERNLPSIEEKHLLSFTYHSNMDE